jgi:hypothetical protein
MRRDAVNPEQFGVATATESPVLMRQADREARRVDARLRCKAHEAPERLAVSARGHDEHRILELADERMKDGGRVAHRRNRFTRRASGCDPALRVSVDTARAAGSRATR